MCLSTAALVLFECGVVYSLWFNCLPVIALLSLHYPMKALHLIFSGKCSQFYFVKYVYIFLYWPHIWAILKMAIESTGSANRALKTILY